jgi:hypothetical protein
VKLLSLWAAAVVVLGWVFHRVMRASKREEARREFRAHLAAVTEAAEERIQRYEVRGVEIHAIETIHEAKMSDAEADYLQRQMALGLVACAMARAFRHKPPMQARA